MEQIRKKIISNGLLHPFLLAKLGLRTYYEKYFEKKIKADYGFTQLPTVDMLDLLGNINETVERYTFLDGMSPMTDMILLKGLARKFDNCQYMEIGSWRGESIYNVAQVAGKCTSVTLSQDQMRGLSFDPEIIRQHTIFIKDKPEIKVVLENSFTFDFNTLGEKYDLIFIDGDHTYSGVKNDTEKTFNLRKNNKSIIVWHDYGFSAEVPRHSVLAGILDGIPRDKHKNLYHVSNSMCAVYIEDMPHKTYQTRFPTYPNKQFTLTIKADKL